MSFHIFGDSHAAMPWQSIPGVVTHHIGPVLCFTVGRHKRDLVNGVNISKDVVAGDVACFCFGEIDCRVHVAKHVTQERTYQKIIDEIVNDYFIALMENEKLVPGVRMAVYNVVPPCSSIGAEFDPAYPFTGSDDDRKAYARYFNEAFAWNCGELGWTFVDVYDRYADAQGFLDKQYSDGNVHIINPIFIEEFLRTHGLL